MIGGPHEVAEYVSDLCSEMQEMASLVGLDALAQLLGVTVLEAKRHRRAPLRIIEGGLEDERKS
jgi:hypothetical protein